ncbi:hypothetical protein BRARA_E03057 [Brassica rapa]|uniref:Zinc finger PHD-type domain-containing protein n=1 Tax=Brassica campestris TaxID=3711 RepID=A0A397ZEN0_BRACM|nr:hypothetical protein BRARA_E03057 [Brassica rapa]
MDSLDHSSPPTTILCPRRRSHRLSPFVSDLKEFSSSITFSCYVCHRKIKHLTDFFWCHKCTLAYHKKCVEPEIKVPYHPKHPLQLLFRSPKSTLHVGGSHYNKCHCCGENTHEGFYYSCSICDFDLLPGCAISLNILSINYPKRHDHTLTYFPRINSLTCDVCALSDDKCFIYVCYQCDFVVHKTCIYLPTTIRISRHDHRLSFTLIPHPNKNWSCGVCRQRVDKNYGRYSCVKDCDYVVHSKCATRKDLWDGRELEGEPETKYEDIKAFKDIGDGVIEHFSHPNHNMRLDKKESDKVADGKRCQACILPIYEGNIYNCMRCDFILHETCAHLPRKKLHPLHAHPLTLQTAQKPEGQFECVACGNLCCGFVHTGYVRCALASDPFTHELHPHPLFLTFEEGIPRTCSICGKQKRHLNCIECSFIFCFRCATLPYKVKYKHDEHYLTLSYEEDTGGHNWCDICERETYPQVGVYTCNSFCSITVHIECLLGADPFMNHNQMIYIYRQRKRVRIFIIPNDGLTRELCMGCRQHCPYRIAFAVRINMHRRLLCSIDCIYSVFDSLRDMHSEYAYDICFTEAMA